MTFSAEIVWADGRVKGLSLRSTTEGRAYQELRKMIDEDPSILTGDVVEVALIQRHQYDKPHFVTA